MRESVLGHRGGGTATTKKLKSEGSGKEEDAGDLVVAPRPFKVVVGRGRSQPGSRRVTPTTVKKTKSEDDDGGDLILVPQPPCVVVGGRTRSPGQARNPNECATATATVTMTRPADPDFGGDVILVPPAVGRSRFQPGSRRIIPTIDNIITTFTVEKALPNGDLYKGSFSGNMPDGTGKYLWADGCMYEGDWRRGRATGGGKFSWPSGATYEGQFKSGRMDGLGTFIGADGDTYRGSWDSDRKHGFGEKRYANEDIYVGSWKWNLQDGEGRYVWSNGNEYLGEWKKGVMCGKGVFIWSDGKRYEGDWEDGMPKGTGVFTWPDGSCYTGDWTGGFDDQRQCFVSPGRKRLSVDTGRGIPNGNLNFPRICIWESDGEAGDITCDIVDNVEASMFYRDSSDSGCGAADEMNRSPCRIDEGQFKKPGQTIFKGHKNYELMLNLQLGIRYSTGKHASITRELRAADFDPNEKFWTRFPQEGSKCTPPHQSVDFRWKDYCPVVFRHLREMFGIDPADYMLAICGNDALREMSSPGKSGSFFYLTQDDRFMIKTVKKSEVKVLIRMLPSYYEHICLHKNSLVTRFFGLHCVKPAGGQKTRFIVMGNLFYSEYRIHKRFDLKGSSHGRSTDNPDREVDETITLKDLDLNYVFRLHQSWFEELIRQVNKDCEFLESEKIMDYSLLVGVHFRNDCVGDELNVSPFDMHAGKRDACPSENMKSGYQLFKADARNVDWSFERRSSPLGNLQIRLGANMPGRAVAASRMEIEHGGISGSTNSTPSQNGGEIFDVVLYFGIIDILQDYDITKKLEHAYKSLQLDSSSISAVDPKLYSKRFQDFIHRIFVEEDE